MGDFMLAMELARRVAAKTGAVAAPTLPFGYADYFRPVAGGVQLSADTFKSLLQRNLASVLSQKYIAVTGASFPRKRESSVLKSRWIPARRWRDVRNDIWP